MEMLDAINVLTGGLEPEIRMKENVKLVEPCFKIKVSDTSNMTFELAVVQSLMPEGLEEGDVIRVKSVVVCTK